ncbi:Gfo/Idh/MocA family protein [Pseudonocardia sp. HH130630-07]|uniref:Gfo/Idh/MocA family protein n=1 Tax=Pseudonocardia sp. HH130630-07 TaxID=1690815 RepID=UPI0008153D7F|nr:Gfo/Idh/MocA family oxidoreductase [Pseudonocardia sp. HH130630-07]ANY07877.1 oxidoreductase [Pseudonocardia sp. HH130630-07]
MTDGTARTLRVAVVGAGERSRIARHVATVRPGSAVVAAVDPDPAARDLARVRFGDIAVYPDLAGLIAAGGIDAAIVGTPDHTHADLAVELLRAGIAVYLEKPLALRIDDADRVLEVAAETGTPLYVGHNYRNAAVVRIMKDVVDRGEIGEVRSIWVRHFVGNGGDYYFKDWHADRRYTGTLLLQKASHDIDVVHMLAGGDSRRVVGMGDLMVYGGVTDRRDRSGERMSDWFSHDNWPPTEATGLNPVVDVEDVSMMMMTLDNGVLASYQQCHFTPDYWRNYTVIGTHGRLENVGDTGGGVVRVWNRRRDFSVEGDIEYPIDGVEAGHDDADLLTVAEFVAHVADGAPVSVTPLAARAAVAAGVLAAESLRDGSRPREVPPPGDRVLAHFAKVAGGGLVR